MENRQCNDGGEVGGDGGAGRDSGREGRDSGGATKDSDDEYFDATDHDAVDHDAPLPTLLAVPEDHTYISPSISISTIEGDPPEIEEDKDFTDSDCDGFFSSNRSLILQLISQVRIGMDLTRFVLPIFIFEKRSLLEFYSEFFSHPDIIVRCADLTSPRERMVEVVRWFISSFSASRKAGTPKKPYNPVLGEVFQCYWDLPASRRTPPNIREKTLLEGGPFCYAGYDSVSFIAEQVSHHPPVSALYLECPSKRIYFHGVVETKIKFQLGLSVKVQNNGKFELHFLNHDEVYVGTFPHAYVRSVLTSPWLEFAGECNVTCAKSGCSATIDFHTKPFRGGDKHRFTGSLRHASENKPYMKLEGHWNSVVFRKVAKDENEVFLDVRSAARIRKKIQKFSLQEEYESRVIWKFVTQALEREDTEAASAAKHEVEEAQRQKTRDLKKSGEEWEPRFFNLNSNAKGPQWVYKAPLDERLKDIA